MRDFISRITDLKIIRKKLLQNVREGLIHQNQKQPHPPPEMAIRRPQKKLLSLLLVRRRNLKRLTLNPIVE